MSASTEGNEMSRTATLKERPEHQKMYPDAGSLPIDVDRVLAESIIDNKVCPFIARAVSVLDEESKQVAITRLIDRYTYGDRTFGDSWLNRCNEAEAVQEASDGVVYNQFTIRQILEGLRGAGLDDPDTQRVIALCERAIRRFFEADRDSQEAGRLLERIDQRVLDSVVIR